jgi:hypothetical protein
VTGGVIDGNGGEYIGNEHNPWFVGMEPVQYCVTRSEDMSISAADASIEIAVALGRWKDFLGSGRFDGVGHKDPEHGLEAGTRRLALDFREVGCDAAPPLVFKLGVSDPSVDAALKYSAARTVGFALRTAYDDVSGRAQGMVWIAPDRGEKAYGGPKVASDFWSRPRLFRNVVLHELGHVFGLQHFKGSLMDARLPAKAVEHGFDADWNADELRANYKGKSFCGVVLFADAPVLTKLWQVASGDGVSVCLKWRGDLQGDADNTPVMLEAKLSDGSTHADLVKVASGEGDDQWVVGLYAEGAAYSRTWFGSIQTTAMYRGALPDGAPVEIEMGTPGAFAIRLPLDGTWQFVSIVPAERREVMLKLLTLLGD